MWSEDFDKKAQDAARNHSPSYNDKDWDKMESLLDKHLPVEKKKRRFIFWIFPLMIGIGLALYIGIISPNHATDPVTPDKIVGTSGSNKSNTTTQPAAEAIPGQNNESNSSATASTSIEDNTSQPAVTVNEVASPTQQTSTPASAAEQTLVLKRSSEKNATSKRTPTTSTSVAENSLTDPAIAKENKIPNPAIPAPVKASPATPAPIPVADASDQKATPNTSSAITTKDSTAASIDLAGDNKAPETAPRKKPKKSNDKGFTAGLSLGPDISGLGMNNTGSWQMQYGLSIGYAFSKSFSIRTGFLASHKIYTADPSEYHPPYNFWTYYPKVEKIDANCLVYEIPITAVYNFPSSKKHNWFISTGVSSYIMKDETYNYYYKNAAGVSEMRTRTIKNENSHLFSVINLSGGYTRNFSKRFYLMAEPYVKIPVSGVGYGKVKLNSGGVLFTVGARF